MPTIKIKRGSQTASNNPTLQDGELYVSTGGGRGEGHLFVGTVQNDDNTDKVSVHHADGADNSTYAEKVGTESSPSTVGKVNLPVHVKNGVVAECDPLIINDYSVEDEQSSVKFYAPTDYGNDGDVLVWTDFEDADPGYDKDDRPMWKQPSTLSVGYATKIGSEGSHPAIGDQTNPVFVNGNGQVTQGSKYAGGTKVTLNGESKGSGDATFYAPTQEIGRYYRRADHERVLADGLFAIEYQKVEGEQYVGNKLSTVVSVANYESNCEYSGNGSVVITYNGNTGLFSVSDGYELTGVRCIVYYQE